MHQQGRQQSIKNKKQKQILSEKTKSSIFCLFPSRLPPFQPTLALSCTKSPDTQQLETQLSEKHFKENRREIGGDWLTESVCYPCFQVQVCQINSYIIPNVTEKELSKQLCVIYFKLTFANKIVCLVVNIIGKQIYSIR